MKNFKEYSYFLVFDIETTGLDYENDAIIEFGGVLIEATKSGLVVVDTLEYFIKTDKPVPQEILDLTHIRMSDIQSGITQNALADYLKKYHRDDILWVAYNAQFDISFINTLCKNHCPNIRFKPEILDLMTVYKDHYDYPHKLDDALNQFKIISEGPHRAIYDAKASFKLMRELEKRHGCSRYINVIGYNPKYCLSGVLFNHVRYLPHPYKKQSLFQQLSKKNPRF